MEKKGTWGDGTVLSMAALLYKRQIVVMTADGDDITVGPHVDGTDRNEPIRLCYVHFSSIKSDITKNQCYG
jgi:hypothetical protein